MLRTGYFSYRHQKGALHINDLSPCAGAAAAALHSAAAAAGGGVIAHGDDVSCSQVDRHVDRPWGLHGMNAHTTLTMNMNASS